MKKLPNDKTVISFLVLILGIASFIFSFSFESIESTKDFKQVHCILEKTTFKENQAGNNHEFEYIIYTSNPKYKFRIEENIFRHFDRKSFQSKVKKGSEIDLYVLKKDVSNLGPRKEVFCYGLSANNLIFMKIETSISELVFIKKIFFWGGIIMFLGALIAAWYFQKTG
jgi:hypothetical protein